MIIFEIITENWEADKSIVTRKCKGTMLCKNELSPPRAIHIRANWRGLLAQLFFLRPVGLIN